MQNLGVNKFVEKNISNSFIPQVKFPTSITEKSITLTDNSYEHNSNCVSGNVTIYISDQLC